jgi:hypothetical protein
MTQQTNEVLLEEAIQVAKKVGLSVCLNYLEGVGGQQPAKAKSQRWVMLDRQQPPREGLMHLVNIIKAQSSKLPSMSPELGDVFSEGQRRAA